MDDFILIEGDQVTFLPNFGAAVVVVHPGQLKGSGPCTLNGKKVCVDGDQDEVSLPGCPYMTPQYSIPGNGTLKIAALAPNQKARQTTMNGKALLLKGGDFIAKFEVQSPARQPPPGPGAPIPDPTRQYSGAGRFVTTNTVLKTS
jgi:Contractile injection system spike tip protein